ncbi:hypothetical protein GCM10027456_28510 [Kineosporia babensis]
MERASSVPLSASCMVNRAEMLALVERARAELPVELDQAAELLVAHQEVISRAESEAEQLLAQAQADAERLIMESALVASARARSDQILDAARAEAARLLRECDLYTDNRLAALQADLARTLGQVQRGRDRLRERSELDYLDPLADEADPEGRDVQVDYEAVERQRARELQQEQRRARDQAYDHQRDQAYDHRADTEDAYDQDAYDQDRAAEPDRAGAPRASRSGPEFEHRPDARDEPGARHSRPAARDTPDTAGADLTGAAASSDAQNHPEHDENGRIPIPVGAGPERRVLDLTAVERAAERSGLG